MNLKKETFAGIRKKSAAGAALLALLAAGTTTTAAANSNQTVRATNAEKQINTTPSKFYCNTKALTAEEREHHKRLSEKLMAAKKAIAETEMGYEFQFVPQDVTLAELADWVAAESKCCPFFDFHIDLENEGKLVCLRLTGEEGVKQFVRTEFRLK